jgi:tRNA-dihydrouridine synthase
MSKGPADWNAISRAADIIYESGSSTLCFGNGDIFSYENGMERASVNNNIHGVMIGRGCFGNPCFGNHKDARNKSHGI